MGRKVPSMLAGLDAGNLINVAYNDDVAQDQHTTRATVYGRADALYNMKYHPMDEVVRPERARKLHAGSTAGDKNHPKRDRSTIIDRESDDSGDSSTEARRRSTRACAQNPIDYNAKRHPQDAQLAAAGIRRRRDTKSRKKALTADEQSGRPVKKVRAHNPTEEHREQDSGDERVPRSSSLAPEESELSGKLYVAEGWDVFDRKRGEHYWSDDRDYRYFEENHSHRKDEANATAEDLIDVIHFLNDEQSLEDTTKDSEHSDASSQASMQNRSTSEGTPNTDGQTEWHSLSTTHISEVEQLSHEARIDLAAALATSPVAEPGLVVEPAGVEESQSVQLPASQLELPSGGALTVQTQGSVLSSSPSVGLPGGAFTRRKKQEIKIYTDDREPKLGHAASLVNHLQNSVEDSKENRAPTQGRAGDNGDGHNVLGPHGGPAASTGGDESPRNAEL